MTAFYDSRYVEYFRLFQEEKYFEAHEVLEGLWRETKDKKRDFYHGLIQLAAALVHFQKGNLHGAKELFRTASRYLKPYLPRYEGVFLSKVLKDYEAFLEVWSQAPQEGRLAREFLPRVVLENQR
jgi:hypothetical protein